MRDKAINDWERIVAGEMKGKTALEARQLMSTFSPEQIAARQGVSVRDIDWAKVSPGTAWRLAEEQFQAAKTPLNTQEEFFRRFNEYLETLQK